MKYGYRIDEINDETDEFIRSVNAYTSLKRAEQQADRLNDEAFLGRTGKRYEVCEA